MRKRIVNKLRSRTGASITFALLLFLVCAVLCSVIITAATASSGRMSQIAETDQRYYAVSSAAELLQKQIDGKTVSIVKVEETEYTTTYTSGVAGEPVEGTPVIRIYIVAGKKASEIDEEEDYVAENLVDGSGFVNDTIPKDAAKNVNAGTQLNGRILALASTFYSSADLGLDYDALAVTISEDLYYNSENDQDPSNGNITLTIHNTNKSKDTTSNAGDRYTLILPFGVDRSESTNTKTENVSSTAVSDTEYTVVTKTTKTTITTLTWQLTGIKTGS